MTADLWWLRTRRREVTAGKSGATGSTTHPGCLQGCGSLPDDTVAGVRRLRPQGVPVEVQQPAGRPHLAPALPAAGFGLRARARVERMLSQAGGEPFFSPPPLCVLRLGHWPSEARPEGQLSLSTRSRRLIDLRAAVSVA